MKQQHKKHVVEHVGEAENAAVAPRLERYPVHLKR
jgi:hypothetical protein